MIGFLSCSHINKQRTRKTHKRGTHTIGLERIAADKDEHGMAEHRNLAHKTPTLRSTQNYTRIARSTMRARATPLTHSCHHLGGSTECLGTRLSCFFRVYWGRHDSLHALLHVSHEQGHERQSAKYAKASRDRTHGVICLPAAYVVRRSAASVRDDGRNRRRTRGGSRWADAGGSASAAAARREARKQGR